VSTFTARFTRRFDLHIFGVVWAATNYTDNTYDYRGPAAPWSDFEGHRLYVSNIYPVSSFSIDPIPGIGTQPPNPQSFGNLTESRAWATKKLAELPAGSIINLLDNWDTGGLHGLASGKYTEEQNQRTSGRLGNVMAQEVAHALGLWWHTFTEGTPYPRSDGSIGPEDMGVNIIGPTPQLVTADGAVEGRPGFGTYDIMSYHTPPPTNWVSSFTYLELMKALNGWVLP
jgi:hypothetical protein